MSKNFNPNHKILKNALYLLGRNKRIRVSFINFLKKSEKYLNHKGSRRDEIIGPIVDALHDDYDTYTKLISNRLKIKFFYRSKISREFLLSSNKKPSHVWEPQTTKLLVYLSKNLNNDVLIGGAYFGDQAILISKNLYLRNATIHCFEPNLEQNKMLRNNIKINRIKNIKVNKYGLWSHSKKKLKLIGYDSFASSILAPYSSDGFKTITIDEYCFSKKINLGLIHLDIEGSEVKALEGAKKTITRDKPVIIFEIHSKYVDWSQGLENTKICKMLLKENYTIFAVRDFHHHQEMKNKPIELIPLKKIFLKGPPHGFNMIAITNKIILRNLKYKIVENVSPKLLLHKNPKFHHPIGGM